MLITLGLPPSEAAISDAFGVFLPTLFVLYALWRIAFRWMLPAFDSAVIERAILFLGPFWVGVLENMTFDKIPIDRCVRSVSLCLGLLLGGSRDYSHGSSRLTPHDIKQRPGGLIAVVVLACVVVVCAVNQIRVIRKTGWLPRYLAWSV
jgi:hypothetical protein